MRSFFALWEILKKQPFLFVLAMSIFFMLSHSFVPHHHHAHSITLREEDNCNEKESNEDEHKNPFHCHAFNDIDWYSQKDNSYESSWPGFEISLTDYYYQSDFFFESQVLLQELKKEELMIEVDSMKSIGNE